MIINTESPAPVPELSIAVKDAPVPITIITMNNIKINIINATKYAI